MGSADDALEVAGFRLDIGRLWTHWLLLLLTVAGCLFIFALSPGVGAVHGLTIALGYLSLLYMVVTLAIGPLKLLRRRRNPMNIHLRRDVGIWAGITGCLHVFFGFQVHLGGQILLYFFEPGGLVPQLNLFGLSNYLGLVATILLVGLLVLSNDISLRKLRGPKWKVLQRFNYALFGLVVLHMLGYQAVIARDTIIRDFSYILVLIALVAQGMGLGLYRANRSRKPRPAEPVRQSAIHE